MKIVVLAGGTSTERTVSITSGTGICTALRQKGHQAILVDIFCGVENVDWENPFPAEYDVEAASAYMSSFNDKIEEMKKERRNFFGPNVLKLCEAADIVFLGLHGANGEDGKVQATFDLMGIKYTGTGYLSSAMAMDKGITKQMFLMNNVPTPRGISMTKDEMTTPAAFPQQPYKYADLALIFDSLPVRLQILYHKSGARVHNYLLWHHKILHSPSDIPVSSSPPTDSKCLLHFS